MSAFPAATEDARHGTTGLAERYRAVRARSIALAAPLSAEDAMVQSMPDASPAKWHLAHTTWFFERFVIGPRDGHSPVDPQRDNLFTSSYHIARPLPARPRRRLVTPPTLKPVLPIQQKTKH